MTEVLKSLTFPKLSILRGQVFTIVYCNDYNSLSVHVDFSWCLFQLPTKNEDHNDEKTVVIANKSPLGNGVKISAIQKSIDLDAHHDTVKTGLYLSIQIQVLTYVLSLWIKFNLTRVFIFLKIITDVH